MKTLNQISLCKYGWLVKYVIVLPNGLFGTNVDKTHGSRKYQLLRILQRTNAISIISRRGAFSTFLSSVIFSSVLSSNFIVSGIKSSR